MKPALNWKTTKPARARSGGPRHAASAHYPLSRSAGATCSLRRRLRPRLLVIGCGDVGMRLVRQLKARLGARLRIIAATRDPARQAELRRSGAVPLALDLDRRADLRRCRGLARWVVHLAPPPPEGTDDPRSRRVVAALARPSRSPGPGQGRVDRSGSSAGLRPRWVYIGTTGVYGDCDGAWVDESRPVRPGTPRAVRRVAAERHWRRAARGVGARLALLRAPGIYAGDRLPEQRLRRGTPALEPADDVFTNHIHAEDLAGLCFTALCRAGASRVYHAVDDNRLKMGDYFDRVADALGLPRPPRVSRQRIAEQVSPANLSFMSESRRLLNHRLRRELRYRLRFPTVERTLVQLSDPVTESD